MASFPSKRELARSAHDFGRWLSEMMFVFQATTNASMRSPVHVSNRYDGGIAFPYGAPRHGTRMFFLCWKNVISVPFDSTTSAPDVPAAASWYRRAVTSSLDPRNMLTLMSGYLASKALMTDGPI